MRATKESGISDIVRFMFTKITRKMIYEGHTLLCATFSSQVDKALVTAHQETVPADLSK